MNYNPYDMLQVSINGTMFMARPITFDSEVHDHIKMTNVKGHIIKPNRIATTCPRCAGGIECDVVLNDPPFPVIDINCDNCNPPYVAIEPFIHPIQSGRIHITELSPNIADISQQVSIDKPSQIEVKQEHNAIINDILEKKNSAKKERKIQEKKKDKNPKLKQEDDLVKLLDTIETEPKE